ncbi:MAG TPA: hypothetical protein EYH34_10530, partial [Planctomycetes bacterium]|nr:hypothetical protein [Planctomycetota bacterium]
RGWRHWFLATGLPGWQRAAWGWPAFGAWGAAPEPYIAPPGVSAEQEIEWLKQQASGLSRTLDEINQRIEELEAKSKES